MDLLQRGVDRTVIALWLGHESIETTQLYLDADLTMKQRALDKTGRHEASSWFPSEAELKSTGFHLTHLGYALLEAVAPSHRPNPGRD